ncbi:MAG: Hint domain-containing protein, partial [Pseudomonadota bacterium]
DAQAMTVGADTELGTPGAELHLDCALTLMSENAPVTEVLVLVQVDAAGHAEEVFALPLAPLTPKTEYQLVGLDRTHAAQKLAQVACVSFTRGTHITMGSGRQRPIEELKPGDPVLTRDDGVQPIRWIGQSTQRAVGEFAPIRITAGTLNNTRDLIVSPDHRLFIYQRTDRLGAGRSELLVKARHLVNDQSVSVQQGGFVDYFQLLFDTHQIIYAEGIAAESMFVDDRTAPLLPPLLAQNGLDGQLHRHRNALRGLDVKQDLLDHPDAADLLRRASLR